MIIGLAGNAGVGKDTVGAYLVEHYGFTRFAFADAIKELALILDPIIQMPGLRAKLSILVGLFGWDDAKQIPEVREYIQRLGTEACRKVFGDEIWNTTLMRKINGHLHGNQDARIVITDVRHPSEPRIIRAFAQSQIWRIERPDNPLAISTNHDSEKHVKSLPVDAILMNVGDVESLKRQVDSLCAGLLDRRAFKADENTATVETKQERENEAGIGGELKYFFCDEHQSYCGSEIRVLISVHEKQKCHVPTCDKPAQFKKAEPAIGISVKKMYRCEFHKLDIAREGWATYRTPVTATQSLCEREDCVNLGKFYGVAN